MPASPRPFGDGQHAVCSRQAARVPRLTGAAERRRAPCGAPQDFGRGLLCPKPLSLSAGFTLTGCRKASPPRAGRECHPDPPQRRPPFREGQETQRVSPPGQGPRHLRGVPASTAQASARPGGGEVPADGGPAARGISVAQGKGDGLCQRDRAFRTAQPPLARRDQAPHCPASLSPQTVPASTCLALRQPACAGEPAFPFRRM